MANFPKMDRDERTKMANFPKMDRDESAKMANFPKTATMIWQSSHFSTRRLFTSH
ncbi:MAG TPA: hypothetical protein VGN42_08460 [Pirellulales bacterium]|jgi:hypothetical protein|nr:hypothetical protein [Pirellulales bacterium]